MAEDTREQIRVHDQSVLHTPSLQTSGTETENTCPLKDDAETNVDISNKHDEFDTSKLHYVGNECVYTDPVTKHQYIWDSKKNEWVLQLDGKTPPEDDSKEKSGEGALKFESEVQNNTTVEGNVPCPPEVENTCANNYEFDGESYFYKDLKTGKNTLSRRKIWVIKTLSGRKEFSGIIQEDIFLTGALETLGFSSWLSFHISIIPTCDYRRFFLTISVIIIFDLCMLKSQFP
jgi:hypothetical protein